MGAFDKKVTLEEWLADANRNAEAGVLTVVRVKHMGFDEQGNTHLGEEVIGRIFAQGKAWSPKEEAALILGRCKTWSQEMRGEQTFKVQAYYGQDEPSASFHFSVTGKTMTAGGVTEEPTARGQAAQGMRMADLVVSRAFHLLDRLQGVQEHLMVELREDRNFWHQEARDAETIIRDRMREEATQVAGQKMKMLEFERSTLERQKLMTFLPALLRHLTGDRNIIPEGLADTSILESAALAIRKMPPEQQQETMTKLAGVSPELVMVLAGRLKEIGDRQEKEEEAAHLLAAARTEEEKANDIALAQEAMRVAGLGETKKLTE